MNSCLVLIVSAALFLVADIVSSFGQEAAAQGQEFEQSPALSINVARIFGKSGQTVPMNFSITGEAEKLLGFVIIRGIPDEFKLSSGFLNGKTWLVSLSELDHLRLIVPNSFVGRFDLEVIFIVGGSKQKYIRYTYVSIQPKSQPAEPVFALDDSKQTQVSAAPIVTQPEVQPTKPVIFLDEGKQTQIPVAPVATQSESQPTEPVGALDENEQTQPRSVFVITPPERRLKGRLATLEESEQTQPRSTSAIALPERKPKERLQAAVEPEKALPQVTLAVSPPAISPEREEGIVNSAAKPAQSYDVEAAREIYNQLANNGTLLGGLGLIKPRYRASPSEDNVVPTQSDSEPAQ